MEKHCFGESVGSIVQPGAGLVMQAGIVASAVARASRSNEEDESGVSKTGEVRVAGVTQCGDSSTL